MLTGIWLLSTRGRPEACQETLDACAASGMTQPGVVYCDETDYPALRLPANWTKHHEPAWGSLQASLQWAFERFPDAAFYGWLADDNRPRTPGWDVTLSAAAGRWGLSYGRDMWQSEDPSRRRLLESGDNMTSGCCWGGDLVRTVGWWALPGVRQAGIDMAWLDIVRPMGLHRYRHDVVVEHWNWRTGLRPEDEGDSWFRDGVDYVSADLKVKNEWVSARQPEAIIERVQQAIACGS